MSRTCKSSSDTFAFLELVSAGLFDRLPHAIDYLDFVLLKLGVPPDDGEYRYARAAIETVERNGSTCRASDAAEPVCCIDDVRVARLAAVVGMQFGDTVLAVCSVTVMIMRTDGCSPTKFCGWEGAVPVILPAAMAMQSNGFASSVSFQRLCCTRLLASPRRKKKLHSVAPDDRTGLLCSRRGPYPGASSFRLRRAG